MLVHNKHLYVGIVYCISKWYIVCHKRTGRIPLKWSDYSLFYLCEENTEINLKKKGSEGADCCHAPEDQWRPSLWNTIMESLSYTKEGRFLVCLPSSVTKNYRPWSNVHSLTHTHPHTLQRYDVNNYSTVLWTTPVTSEKNRHYFRTHGRTH